MRRIFLVTLLLLALSPAVGQTAGVPLASVASRRTIAVHRVTAVAAKGQPPPGIARRIVGRFKGPGEVVVFRGSVVIRRAKPKHGRFVIPIAEGTYGIAGRLPSGRYCRGKKVIVPPDRPVSVMLRCET